MTGNAGEERIVLTGGSLRCALDRATGRIVELIDQATGDEFVSAKTGPGGLEVYDELTGQWYSDLQTASTVSGLHAGEGQVRLLKQFAGAPFSLDCTWRAGDDGLHLAVDAALLPGAERRSIRISLVLPAGGDLVTWAPSYPPPTAVGQNPPQYCYLADERGKARTGIPMLTVYHPGRGGLSMVMPFETPKVQLNMGAGPTDPRGLYVPERVPAINAGAEVDTVSPPAPADLGTGAVVRFTEKHVGLRPGRPLRFALWLLAHGPDWRLGLAEVVRRYAEYFEPHPDAARLAGGRMKAVPTSVTPQAAAEGAEFRMTHAWFHGHFEFHGEFLTDEALTDPDYRWVCEPYPTQFRDLSVREIREKIHLLKEAGVGTFLYGFNMHCDPTVIAKRRLQADMCRKEDGDIARAYHDQPVMCFGPDTPFGRQQLDQADRMMTTYPEILGLALDNWNYTGIDFGHDDGITMVNHTPAANVNFSQQRFIRALAEKVHGTGRLLITNKGRTIESMRGVDLVLTEAAGAETYATFTFMNMFRTVTPTEYAASKDAAYAEGVMKYVLAWGGQMGSCEREPDVEMARAYERLMRLLRNRRWVLEADPVTIPAGAAGQIFRIDPRSPWNAGAVVVTVVRPLVSWRDGSFAELPPVKVRLHDAARFRRAEWLGVENSAAGPAPCRLNRSGSEITIPVPPVGAAGVVKLS